MNMGQVTLGSLRSSHKSEVEIILKNENAAYSTFDTIQGHVDVRFNKPILVGDFSIALLGQVDTWVEKMTATAPRMGRATARHTFLRMQQALTMASVPDSGIIEAGVTHGVPFSFTVPENMTASACKHRTEDDIVRSQHLCLPPSLGSSKLASKACPMNDMSPDMATIAYWLQLTLVKTDVNGNSPDVVQKKLPVRIVPTYRHLPPVKIDSILPCEYGIQYQLRKEKRVHTSMLLLGKRYGTMTAQILQPPIVKTSFCQQLGSRSASAEVAVHLRYDPISAGETPPRLDQVVGRLKAYTYFGVEPFKVLPDPSSYNDVWMLVHSKYSKTSSLQDIDIKSVNWMEHQPQESHTKTAFTTVSAASMVSKSTIKSPSDDNGSSFYRNLGRHSRPSSSSASLVSTSTLVAAGENSNWSEPADVEQSRKHNSRLSYYTSLVVVPIRLQSEVKSEDQRVAIARKAERQVPSKLSLSTTNDIDERDDDSLSLLDDRTSGQLTLLPSFHSCLVSRIYVLDLTIKTAKPATKIKLCMPLQVSMIEPSRSAAQSGSKNT